MKNEKICLVGENILAGQALQQTLNTMGYDTFLGSLDAPEAQKRILDNHPGIIIWDEELLEVRDDSIFDFQEHIEGNFGSIFILSSKTIRLLGLGLAKGIEGFVHKKGGIKDLENCLDKLSEGLVFISPLFTDSHELNGGRQTGKRSKEAVLTSREETILRYIKQGKMSKEIAKILNISLKTVQNHRQNMCNKLGLKGRNRLAEFARSYGEL